MGDKKKDPLESGPVGEQRKNAHPNGWFPDRIVKEPNPEYEATAEGYDPSPKK
jgi:hypothetical protein